ncbi:Dihydroxyacetone kinase 2 [Paecilomyces lecythidis]
MASERRFIQDPVQLVREWSRAQLQLQPGLRFDERFGVLFKPNLADANRVTVISGGGSGHEPAHAGYLGDGMLDATVAGTIFSSPNIRQIYRGLEAAASPKGTIVIVKNYTGDKLNFSLAAERYKAATGQDVRVVLVAEDVSVPRSRGKFVGRRGLAAAVLIHKVAGAAAHRGLNIDRIVQLCDKISNNVGTFGVSLAPCYVPGQQGVEAGHGDEINLGMGIHNEPAFDRLPADTPTEEVIKKMLNLLLDWTNKEHGFLSAEAVKPGRRFVLLMNNLGGLSTVELGALTSLVSTQLKSTYNIVPCRTYAGTFLSALDGRGFSITLLSLDDSEDASTILSLLNDPTTANGWTSSIPINDWSKESAISESPEDHGPEKPRRTSLNDIYCDKEAFVKVIKSIYTEVAAVEPALTQYDTIMGDGDCGTTLLAGAQAMLQGAESGSIPTHSLTQGTLALAEIVTEAMGGTSGGIYGIYLSAFASSLNQLYEENAKIDVRYFARAATEALNALEKFTGARVGDRTLMDALIPFVTTLDSASKEKPQGLAALETAVAAASEGSESTRNLQARFGRSAYVKDDSGETQGEEAARVPDPGAYGLAAVLNGLLKALK